MSSTAATRLIRLSALAVLLSSLGAAQTAALSLASGSGSPGSVVVLNLSLTSTVTQPTDLQWTINYPTKDFSSLTVSAGPAITAAGRSINCNNTPGASTCVVWGMSSSGISNGVAATLSFTISNSTTDTSSVIQVSKGGAASLGGAAIATSTTGSTVAIAAVQTVPITVTSAPAGRSLTVDGNACTAPCNAQWVAGSSHTINVSSNPQAGTVGTQYVYSSWSDGGMQSRTVVAPASSQTYTANFTTQYFLTTSATLGGSISPASAWNNSGTAVMISATAQSGNQFTGFGGSLTGTTNPQTLTMNGPAAVTANFSATSSGPGWYNPAWTNRKAITINSGNVNGTLTNFPMLVSFMDMSLVGNTRLNGGDILFTASDGVTKLNHEIESYDNATGTLVAWVNVPSLATGTVVYMYYGNPGAQSQQSVAGVWDSNFEMVQHLPNGTMLSANDSTANGCNATTLNSTAAAAGEIAGGASLNGVSNSIDFAPCAALNNWTSQTISLWVKAKTGMAQYARLIEKGANSEWSLVWNYFGGTNRLSVESLGDSGSLLTPALPLADNTWHKVDVTITGQGAVAMYIDGALSAQGQSPGGPQTTTGTIRLGQYGGGGYFYNGLTDELRVSNVARSAAWIAAEYNNEKSPGTFASVGPLQQQGNGTVSITLMSAPAGMALTLDGNACAAPCSAQWVPGTSHTIGVNPNPQAGTAGTQYSFANWSDNGTQSHTVVAPGTALTYTANFTTQYFLTTSATTGGTISPASGWNNSGAVVSVSATVSNGSQFTGFSGSLSGTTTPQTLTMNGPMAVTASFNLATGGPGWYNTAWTSRKAITINNGQVNGTLTNFPMLYSVADLSLAGAAQLSGNDILFTASDGVTKLNHEIESYFSPTGTLAAWVKVPALANGTVIYMYYGNPSAFNQQSAAGVWDSNFEMVQHFPNWASLSAHDSTANGCNSSSLNAASATVGEIAGGAGFSASSIDFGSCAALNNWTAQTISLWAKAQPGMAQYARLIEKGSNSEWSLIWNYVGGSNRLTVESLGGTSNLLMSSTPVADNTWHKVDVTITTGNSLSGGNSVSMYIDGVLNGQAQSPVGPQNTTGTIRLGQYGGGGYYYNGLADELKISNSVRSAAWIAAEYNNQRSPATFASVGPVQQQGGGGGGGTGSNTVTITVTSAPPALALTVDGNGCVAPCSAQWVPGSIHTINVSSSLQAGTAGTQYMFANWSDSGTPSHTVVAPGSSQTYTANFTTQYYLTTSATTGGTISPASGWNNGGAAVSVSATVLSGNQFMGFSGSVTGMTNPQSLTLNGPAAVTATFSPMGSGPPPPTGPSWYNAAWTGRKAITINGGQVTGTLTNFPMLLSVTDANLAGAAQLNGNDILFTASDGVTKLNHEIESYFGPAGTLVAWVKVPALANGTVIYMYYGNPGAFNQQSVAGVWDSNFEMVQHFPNWATLSAHDSTANGCNASSLGATSSVVGEIAGGAGFSGSSIDFGSCAALNNWTAQTISLWVKAQPGMAEYARLIEKGSNSEWSVIWNYVGGSNRLSVESLGGTSNLVMSSSPVADSTWHKVDVAITSGNGINSVNSVTMYIDGALNGQAQSPVGPQNTTGTIRLGQYGGGGYYYFGLADELRISNTVRSAAWIAAEYKNEKSPAAFYTIGPPAGQ
jgi:hypothetical protein